MPADVRTNAVVVNADDLGLSSDVNAAIAESFDRGWVSSASIMINRGAFSEAIALANARNWRGRIGVHLNLADGEPLTAAIRRCSRLCGPDGRMALRCSALFRITAAEAAAIEQELTAQIRACIDAGLTPTHLDSHGHAHTQWPIGGIVMNLARRFSIPAVRLSRNCGPSPGLAKAIYKRAFNARLAHAGLARVRYFGSARDAAGVVATGRGAVEVMVHPVSGPNRVILDASEKPEPLEAAIRRLDVRERLMSFGQLAMSRS